VRSIESIRGERRFPGGIALTGTVTAATEPITFLRIPREPAGVEPAGHVEVPAESVRMPAIWVRPDPVVFDRVAREPLSRLDARLSLGHALRMYSGLYCDISPMEVVEAYGPSRTESRRVPSVFLLGPDGAQGDALLAAVPRMLSDALEILRSCECRHGCPDCVGCHEVFLHASAVPERLRGRRRPRGTVRTGDRVRFDRVPDKRCAALMLGGLLQPRPDRAAPRTGTPNRRASQG
jgi:hypothetical protein